MAHATTSRPTYRRGVCPRCDPVAEQQLLFSLEGDRTAGFSSLSLFGCECGSILLYDTSWPASTESETKEFIEHSTLLWPTPVDLPEQVPENVRVLYAGALNVKSHPDPFVVQIRRTIQAMCVSLGARSYDEDERHVDLIDMLGGLSKRGVFPSQVRDVLHEIRYLGNVGAHGIDVTVDPEIAQIVDELFRLLVQYIYEIPHKLDNLRRKTQTLRLRQNQNKRNQT